MFIVTQINLGMIVEDRAPMASINTFAIYDTKSSEFLAVSFKTQQEAEYWAQRVAQPN